MIKEAVNDSLPRLAILGNGRWGMALAHLAVRKGVTVALWGRHSSKPKLSPELAHIAATDDLVGAVTTSDVVIIALPAQAIESVCQSLIAQCSYGQSHGLPDGLVPPAFISAAKGMQIGSRRLPSQIIRQAFPQASIAVLAGPNFAAEISTGLPAAAVLAGDDEACGLGMQVLSQKSYRLYRQHSLIGVELCGVVKNIIAIACGICQGLELGDNAKAALMTRGLVEMRRLAAAHSDANPEKLSEIIAGLAGIGDLCLTCGSLQSRNMAFGYALGQGQSLSQARQASQGVCEGSYAAQPILELGRRYKLDLPIIAACADIIEGRQDINSAIQHLLNRPLPAEEA